MYDTGNELIAKVDYEGGWFEGLVGYGIRPEDVPEYIRDDIIELIEIGKKFTAGVARLEKKIQDAEGPYSYSDWD